MKIALTDNKFQFEMWLTTDKDNYTKLMDTFCVTDTENYVAVAQRQVGTSGRVVMGVYSLKSLPEALQAKFEGIHE